LALHLDIDPHGRVVTQNGEARKLLADHAGRFLLLPCAPDLLVARRTPAAGGPSTRPRCILAGDLSAFPIADFVAFVHQARLSGLLTVSAAGVDREVVFKDGEVRAAHSTASGERIGQVALRLGRVTTEQLAQAADAGRPFGKVLVDKGFISPSDLWKCLHEQVTTVFHAILLAREGVFTVVDSAEQEANASLSVNTQALLMDGVRRIDEMELFRARIPGPQSFLRRREPKVTTPLEPLEQQALSLVDGRRRVIDVAQAAHLSEFDTMKVLYHLAEAGYLEAAEQPVASPSGTPAERQEAIARAMNALFHEIAVTVATVGGLDLFLTGARTFLADTASRFAPLWRLVLPAKDGTLDPGALLGNLAALKGTALARIEPSGDPTHFLFDGLRELMFFYLFQAGERLPPEADERLGREVKRRFEALKDLV